MPITPLFKCFLILALLCLVGCNDKQKKASQTPPPAIVLGAEQFSSYIPLLKNKRVALLVNQTSVVEGKHLVHHFFKKKISLKKIFTPEHGFKGNMDAGEKVSDSQLDQTPIVSLYGKRRKPFPEDLKDIDIVVFDIQDVGVRFYTYLSTLHLMMEACAENNKKIIVLDRPNPNAHYIDGPILKDEVISFVGMHPIPIVYGMTLGEMAQMINGEFWLKDSRQCDLTVIPLKHWTHQTAYSLPIKPSPNLPNDKAIALYPSLCLFEGTTVSIGRGTHSPFQIAGHPDYPKTEFSFTPRPTEGAKKPKLNGELCYGVTFNTQHMSQIDLNIVIDFYQKMNQPKDFFTPFFDKLAGNTILKQQIIDGKSTEDIRESWQKDLETFKAKRQKYLLYP